MQSSPTISFPTAPIDAYAERITTVIALIGGILMLPALFWFLSGMLLYGIAVPGIVISVATAVALAAWLTMNYAVQPIRYDLTGNSLKIRRRWLRAIDVPIKDILGASPASALADIPRRGLRRSFNAGVFGYNGPFDLEDYGRVFFVATNRSRLVALARRNQMPFILSPERPYEFIEAVRERVARILEEQEEPPVV